MAVPRDAAEFPPMSGPVPLGDSGIATSDFHHIYVSLNLDPTDFPVIGVTSAIRGEGRTTIARGLAHAIATDVDVPVVLVDADVEAPALSRDLNLLQSLGLAEALREGRHIDEFMVELGANSFVVSAGARRENPARLLYRLGQHGLATQQPWARGVTVVDLPPILGPGYNVLPARTVDALILVVRAGITPISSVREAVARLEVRTPDGVVLNDTHSSLPAWWPDRGV